MRLVQLSDCHLLADKQASLYQVNPYRSLVRVLKHVAKQNADAVLVTGDISGDDSQASYHHFVQAMAEFLPGVPWRAIAGNHDNNSHFSSCLRDIELRATTPWSLQPWFIHGLDTRFEGAKGQIRVAELDAIQSSIRCAPRQTHHILVLHHHLVATQSWMDKHALINVEKLYDWLEENPKIQLILHGHIHAERIFSACHTMVLSAPSTCWQWQLSPDFAVDPQPPGYREIYLSQNGEWSSNTRRVP